MKKIIFTAFFAAATLGLTSCNKTPEPFVYTPQCVFTIDVADLMRNVLFEVFALEELTSTKIAKNDPVNYPVDPAVIVNTDAADEVIGWELNFTDLVTPSNYFRGTITVSFTGDPLANGSIKEIDCSQLSIVGVYSTLKLFGSITVENLSPDATETVRRVSTSSLGWGEQTADLSLTANYEFTSKYGSSPLRLTECKISGSASGYHREFLTFNQLIMSDMNVGEYMYFTSGAMTLYANLGDGILPIDVVFNPTFMTITYNGDTETWPRQ